MRYVAVLLLVPVMACSSEKEYVYIEKECTAGGPSVSCPDGGAEDAGPDLRRQPPVDISPGDAEAYSPPPVEVAEETAPEEDLPVVHYEYEVGPEEFVSASGYDRAASVAVDSLGQPHFLTEFTPQAGMNAYHRVAGAWHAQEPLIQKGPGGGPFHPTIRIDAANRAWVSANTFGDESTGEYVGLLHNVSTNPAPQFAWFNKVNSPSFVGNLDIDPFYPDNAFDECNPVFAVTKFNLDGSQEQLMVLDAGSGGEKVSFKISPRPGQPGVWHVATDWSYHNSERQAQAQPRLTWSLYEAYPEMGYDENYLDLGIDLTNPLVAYIVTGRGPNHGNVSLNIFDGQKLLFPNDNLFILATGAAPWSNGKNRFSPQTAPGINGGSFICWTTDFWRVNLAYVHYSGQAAFGETIDVGPGWQCDIATDAEGSIHLMYNNEGVRYRKIVPPSYPLP